MSRSTAVLSFATVTTAIAMTACSGYGTAPGASASTPPAASTPPPATGQCNAQPAQFAVGQNSTSSVMESARARSGAQMARILRPGQMITKEFDAQRLNLEVDSAGKIIAVRCG
ncbi:I78 family peptidase inhibitor [Acidovorax sp. LjRoot129]|uniref:I78 family peptidase inhibitor n=1 Tax=Acidovorax sp. LjRoot129 TaxID=3342260 RepID=UPI003ED0B456